MREVLRRRVQVGPLWTRRHTKVPSEFRGALAWIERAKKVAGDASPCCQFNSTVVHIAREKGFLFVARVRCRVAWVNAIERRVARSSASPSSHIWFGTSPLRIFYRKHLLTSVVREDRARFEGPPRTILVLFRKLQESDRCSILQER